MTRKQREQVARYVRSLRSGRTLAPGVRSRMACFLEQQLRHMTPNEIDEVGRYIPWLKSGRPLTPRQPIRADLAAFVERLGRLERRGQPPKETTIQRYRRRQGRISWIFKVKDKQRVLGCSLDRAIERVLEEEGTAGGSTPEFATLRGWLYEDRGNSRFLPAFDDGSINADPEKI